MIESPLIQELVSTNALKTRCADVTTVLEARFDTVPPDVESWLQSVTSLEVLSKMNRKAATCDSLEAFRDAMREFSVSQS